MIKREEFDSLIQRLRSLESDREQSRGALNELLKQLRTKFGCKTLEQAREKLKAEQEQYAKLEAILRKRLLEFEQENNNG